MSTISRGKVAVTFEVQVPATTNAVVCLCSSALGWRNMGMTRLKPSTYRCQLTVDGGETVWYKYTLGSWETVEKAADGGERPNREVGVASVAAREMHVYDRVVAWASCPQSPLVTQEPMPMAPTENAPAQVPRQSTTERGEQCRSEDQGLHEAPSQLPNGRRGDSRRFPRSALSKPVGIAVLPVGSGCWLSGRLTDVSAGGAGILVEDSRELLREGIEVVVATPFGRVRGSACRKAQAASHGCQFLAVVFAEPDPEIADLLARRGRGRPPCSRQAASPEAGMMAANAEPDGQASGRPRCAAGAQSRRKRTPSFATVACGSGCLTAVLLLFLFSVVPSLLTGLRYGLHFARIRGDMSPLCILTLLAGLLLFAVIAARTVRFSGIDSELEGTPIAPDLLHSGVFNIHMAVLVAIPLGIGVWYWAIEDVLAPRPHTAGYWIRIRDDPASSASRRQEAELALRRLARTGQSDELLAKARRAVLGTKESREALSQSGDPGARSIGLAQEAAERYSASRKLGGAALSSAYQELFVQGLCAFLLALSSSVPMWLAFRRRESSLSLARSMGISALAGLMMLLSGGAGLFVLIVTLVPAFRALELDVPNWAAVLTPTGAFPFACLFGALLATTAVYRLARSHRVAGSQALGMASVWFAAVLGVALLLWWAGCLG